MNKIKPLDQVCSMGRFTPNHVVSSKPKRILSWMHPLFTSAASKESEFFL